MGGPRREDGSRGRSGMLTVLVVERGENVERVQVRGADVVLFLDREAGCFVVAESKLNHDPRTLGLASLGDVLAGISAEVAGRKVEGLGPCPFCGGEDALVYGEDHTLAMRKITCPCGASTPYQQGLEAVVEYWNRRAGGGDGG